MIETITLAPPKTEAEHLSGIAFDATPKAFSPARLGIAAQTIERFVERITRLYEQGVGAIRIGAYVRLWWRWARAGVPTVMKC